MERDREFIGRQLSDKDLPGLIGAVASFLLIIILRTLGLPAKEEAILALDILLSFLVAKLGEKREIGFGVSYILSLFLSPVIGCLAVFASQRKK